MNERYVNDEAAREEAAKGETKAKPESDSAEQKDEKKENKEKKDEQAPRAPSRSSQPQSAAQAEARQAKSRHLFQNCKHHLKQLNQLRQRTSTRDEALGQHSHRRGGGLATLADYFSNMASPAASPTERFAAREPLPQPNYEI